MLLTSFSEGSPANVVNSTRATNTNTKPLNNRKCFQMVEQIILLIASLTLQEEYINWEHF